MDECGRLVARARVRARVHVAIQVFVREYDWCAPTSFRVYACVRVFVYGSTAIYTRVRSNTSVCIFDFHSHNPWLFASLCFVYCAERSVTWFKRNKETYTQTQTHTLPPTDWIIIWMDEVYRLKWSNWFAAADECQNQCE